MELKYQENDLALMLVKGFNRTFMELKYIKTLQEENQKIVLIVPLWN